ncbi:MAG: hypothetical protein ABIR96_06795 [Bdellovibrionota bacterium]
MAIGTIVYAFFLISLGIASYILTNGVSPTALIPTYFGLVVLPLGLFTLLKPQHKRHFMHATSMLSLIAMIGTVKGLFGSFTLMSGGEVARPAASIAQALMFGASLVYLIFCVRSFINARVLKKPT